MKLEKNIDYMGWPNCIRLSNAEVEVIVAADIGLRILRFGFIGGQNMLYLSDEDKGRCGGDSWRIYGGHRLWHAPEAMPRSYSPDNAPISFAFTNQTLKITQARESTTGIIKEMEIRLSADGNYLTVLHRLINQNLWEIKLSPWAISALAAGGRAIVPQEPYGEGDHYLLPARSLALWSYTQMNDPRWTWGNKYIQTRQDSALKSEQKIGLLNKQGWAAYCLEQDLLIKLFAFDQTAEYPDYGSNQEIYINGMFLELETLGPLKNIPPGGSAEHLENWWLGKAEIENSEDAIDRELLPRVFSFQRQI
jgi:hypothetical protein